MQRVKHYFKIITKQDVTRSFVLNQMALEHFFQVRIWSHGDEQEISLSYPSGLSYPTKIVMHQDPRILLVEKEFEIGNIAHFQYLGDHKFKFSFLKGIDNPFIESELSTKRFCLTSKF